MVKIAPMLGAIVTSPPKGNDKKRRGKSKGEKSVTEPKQQHGELLNSLMPTTPPSTKQMTKDHAKHEMRRATEEWVSGRITTKEHKAVHERAKHVMSGKRPEHFKGPSGERKIKGLR
jgi:hypothetical protein